MWVNESAANSTSSTAPEWTEGHSLPSKLTTQKRGGGGGDRNPALENLRTY
uniref:Uncharacterized protein n=1 Tax=Arundo donax TaxID=35708 RepID=A0A0A9BAG5_ARUDO